MQKVWIFKDDGTRQCEDDPGISLKEMAEELETLGAEVLDSEKRQYGVVSTLCGAPTGQVNAYEVSLDDWNRIKKGYVGPNGFRVWPQEEVYAGGPPSPWPTASVSPVELTSARYNPVLVRELIGRSVRCYKQGDHLTLGYQPDRVNIEHDDRNRILDIWFG